MRDIYITYRSLVIQMRGPYPWERDQVAALQREAGIWSRPDILQWEKGLKKIEAKAEVFSRWQVVFPLDLQVPETGSYPQRNEQIIKKRSFSWKPCIAFPCTILQSIWNWFLFKVWGKGQHTFLSHRITHMTWPQPWNYYLILLYYSIIFVINQMTIFFFIGQYSNGHFVYPWITETL